MAFPEKRTSLFNPVSGVFGNGQVELFPESGTFSVPTGVSKVRVRVWGGGGGNLGSGGGFAMKVIDLGGTTSVVVTVGAGGTTNGSADGGTSSFGSYVSATGGKSGTTTMNQVGGIGVGGDINFQGGQQSAGLSLANGYGGAGGAGLFGDGGYGGANNNFLKTVATGAGARTNSGNTFNASLYGFAGAMGRGGVAWNTGTAWTLLPPTHGFEGGWCLDYIATGGGGGAWQNGVNGGGGGYEGQGGNPAGAAGQNACGGYGLVTVEY